MNRRDFLRGLGKAAPVVAGAAALSAVPKPEEPPKIVEVEKVVEKIVEVKSDAVTLADFQKATAAYNAGQMRRAEYVDIHNRFLRGTGMRPTEVVWSTKQNEPVALTFGEPKKDWLGREETYNV